MKYISVAGTKRGAHLALSLGRSGCAAGHARPNASGCRRRSARPRRWHASCPAVPARPTIVAPPADQDLSTCPGCRCRYLDMANLADATRSGPDVEERIIDLIEIAPVVHSSFRQFPAAGRAAHLTAERDSRRAQRYRAARRAQPEGRRWRAGPCWWPVARATAAHPCSPESPPRLGEQGAGGRGGRRSEAPRAAQRPSSPRPAWSCGIDMGAVDLVIQVSSPPSVASGLQRIGRAGHQVGEISQGVLFPNHRTDLIDCAVTVRRMQAGEIEIDEGACQSAETSWPSTPWPRRRSNHWTPTPGSTPIRRSAPFATLPRGVFEATLDLLSGKYPSTEFAELRPPSGVRPRTTALSPPGPERNGWPSPPAARYPTAACSRVYLATEKAFSGRRTRRGDGVRVAAGRCDFPRRDQLADHRDHP